MTHPLIPTCDLCDAHKTDDSGALRMLPPVFRHFGGRGAFCGTVVTVQCFEDNTPVKAQVESPGHGRVLVVDGGGSLRRALMGGNLAASAVTNGWAGVVVDGAVRDVAELAAADLGVCALAPVPMPPVRRQPGLTEVVVRIQGVLVRPGDWLAADADGIVVLDRAPA
jgi:regulator of ribonuclease activity A